MPTTSKINTEGADIVFDHVGRGPLLLTIAGGGGAGAAYDGIAALLADEFTVVTYDRRARSRSTGDRNADLDMAQQACDAACVIRAMNAGKALVFGNSAGANIGLKLVEDHPDLVAALVAHEPPVVSILPDADKELAFMDSVNATLKRDGLLAARKMFMESLVGFDGPPAIGQQMDPADALFFMAHEFLNIGYFKPNLDTIRRSKVPVVAAAGIASKEAYYARTTRVLTRRLECQYAEFPGHHIAFITDPAPFARVLREVLHKFRD